MEANLKFNLPEDSEDLDNALNGYKYKLALWDLDNFLRSEIKHGDDESKATHYEEIRDRLHDLLNEYNLTLL